MANGLSDEQLEALGELMRQVLRDEGVTKEELREAISHLPTKEEFFSKMDELMTEVKKIGEEQPVQAHQIARNSDRLDRVEKRLKLPAFE